MNNTIQTQTQYIKLEANLIHQAIAQKVEFTKRQIQLEKEFREAVQAYISTFLPSVSIGEISHAQTN